MKINKAITELPQSCHESTFTISNSCAPPNRSLSIIEQSVAMTWVGVGHPTSPLSTPGLSVTVSVTAPCFK